MSRQTISGFAVLLLAAALILWIFQSRAVTVDPGRSPSARQSDPAEPAVATAPPISSPAAAVAVPPSAASGSLVEGPSDDPLVTRFFDADGRLAKTVRRNAQGQAIAETTYQDGQEMKIERTYSESGQLLRERQLRNGTVLKNDQFH
jgi:hypothetical protein